MSYVANGINYAAHGVAVMCLLAPFSGLPSFLWWEWKSRKEEE